MASKYTSERYDPTVGQCQADQNQTPRPKLQLRFDGKSLIMQGTRAYTYPAVSGMSGADPIPQGRYWINPSELWQRTGTTNIYFCIGGLVTLNGCSRTVDAHKKAWGNHRITIHPYQQTDTHGRGGFFIHGGTVYGSLGCIDLAGNMDQFVKDLQAELGGTTLNCFADLVVTYPAP